MTDRHQKPSYPLRMPDALRTSLEEAAKQNNRSMNAEIVARLEQSFSGGVAAVSEALALSARLQAELAQLKYQEHLRAVEMQEVAETVRDLLDAIEQRGLTDKIESDVHSLEELEQFARTPRFSRDFLAQLAAEREKEMVATKKLMESALARLARRADPEAEGP